MRVDLPLNKSFSVKPGPNHTVPNFPALIIYSFGKNCEKRRICLKQPISHFLRRFSTLYGTYFSFQMHFKMSSAICSSLDQSNTLAA